MRIQELIQGLMDIAKQPRDQAIEVACDMLDIPTKYNPDQARDERGRFGSGGVSSGRITSESDDNEPIIVAGKPERDRVQDETVVRVGDSMDDGKQPSAGPPAYARPSAKPKK